MVAIGHMHPHTNMKCMWYVGMIPTVPTYIPACWPRHGFLKRAMELWLELDSTEDSTFISLQTY